MNKIKKVISLIILAGLLVTAGGAAYADGIDSAVYNEDTDTITVSGTFSENIATSELKPDTSNAAAKGWRGWNGTGVSTVADTKDGFDYVTTSKNSKRSTGIAQGVYDGLTKYGLGTYRVSGKIKLTGINEGATRQLQISIIKHFSGWNAPGSVKSKYADSGYIRGVTSSWQDFSVDIPILNYGLDRAGNTLTAFPEPSTANGNNSCHILFLVTDLSVGTEENSHEENICISNISVRNIDKVPDKAGITVTDSTDAVIYANEIVPEADGSYKHAFQLADDVTAADLKARLQKNGGGGEYLEKDITNIRDIDKIKTSRNGNSIAVSFDIFDFVDTRNISSLYMVAASYSSSGSELTGIKTEALDIKNDTKITQTVTVGGTDETDAVKLFLLKDMTSIIPLCTVHPETVTE